MTLNAQVTYSAAADQVTFAITFDRLNDAHVKVDINQVNTTDVTVVANDVTVNSPSIAAGDTIKVYRVTPVGDSGRLVDWNSGASITASDLDTSLLQDLYVAEEGLDQATISLKRIGAGETDDWDAETQKIIGVVSGTAATDVCTKGQLDEAVIGASSLPTVGGGDDDSILQVFSAAWATRTPAQAIAAMGLSVIAAGHYRWTPNAGNQSSMREDVSGTWEQNQANRMGNAGVPSACVLTRVNDPGGAIFSRALSGGVNTDIDLLVDGEYIVIVTIYVHNTDNTNKQLMAWALTDELDTGSQTVFFIDENGASINNILPDEHACKTAFVGLSVTGGGQTLALRCANKDGSPVALALGWGHPTQVLVVKIG